MKGNPVPPKMIVTGVMVLVPLQLLPVVLVGVFVIFKKGSLVQFLLLKRLTIGVMELSQLKGVSSNTLKTSKVLLL